MAKMVSLELSDEHKYDAPQPIPMPTKPDYPYGMRICLTHVEMEKLGLDPDCEVGDVLDFAARAVVTNVNHSQSEDGSKCCRVELQTQEMSVEDYE